MFLLFSLLETHERRLATRLFFFCSEESGARSPERASQPGVCQIFRDSHARQRDPSALYHDQKGGDGTPFSGFAAFSLPSKLVKVPFTLTFHLHLPLPSTAF